jgi:ABC-type multidrug transport system permease subunit
MRALWTLVVKDLRLLWRDPAGLVFLMLAPVLVITVAGFSLANLYGADPTGQTAYEFPVVDEDGGPLGTALRTRLAAEPSVRARFVSDRAAARALVRDRKQAGTALIIPAGTEARLTAGEPVALVLYTDAVKYLERLNVRLRLLEIVQSESAARRDRVAGAAQAQREELLAEVERLRATATKARATLQTSWADAGRARADALRRLQDAVARARQVTATRLTTELAEVDRRLRAEVADQVRAVREPLRAYVDTVGERRAAFGEWIARLRELAGSRAAAIPAPPTFPELPASLLRLLDDAAPVIALPAFDPKSIALPPLPAIEVPPLPPVPEVALPTFTVPPPPAVPGTLGIVEEPVGGGSSTINTFDQNVPGFSVTFLLLGMLLGVSLGLLDEREWGTLERLRAMPVSLAHVLVAKLLSRFVVGVVQMVVLLAFGRLAFGISLGPQPLALLLPIVGIVFAGTAFGLVVAGVATTREAVLPVGSMVIVTMAAVGGCWWPIDLEPRWMRTVALAFPTTWAMEAFNDLMIRQRSVGDAIRPTLVMLAYGTGYLLLGVGLFHRRVTRG